MNRRSFLKALASGIVAAGAAPKSALALLAKHKSITSQFDALYAVGLSSPVFLSEWWAPIGGAIVGPILWRYEKSRLMLLRPGGREIFSLLAPANGIEQIALVGRIGERSLRLLTEVSSGKSQIEYFYEDDTEAAALWRLSP